MVDSGPGRPGGGVALAASCGHEWDVPSDGGLPVAKCHVWSERNLVALAYARPGEPGVFDVAVRRFVDPRPQGRLSLGPQITLGTVYRTPASGAWRAVDTSGEVVADPFAGPSGGSLTSPTLGRALWVLLYVSRVAQVEAGRVAGGDEPGPGPWRPAAPEGRVEDLALNEWVGQALGSASMCWDPPPAGVFASRRAGWILDGLMAHLNEVIAQVIAGTTEAVAPDAGELLAAGLAELERAGTRVTPQMREIIEATAGREHAGGAVVAALERVSGAGGAGAHGVGGAVLELRAGGGGVDLDVGAGGAGGGGCDQRDVGSFVGGPGVVGGVGRIGSWS